MELRDVVKGTMPVKISVESTAADALIAMMEGKTDFLLVERTDINDAYGIVTQRDIVEKAVAEGNDLSEVPITDIARKPLVVTNNLDLDIRWIAKKMADENVSKLAVFDRDNFMGFVSDIDLLMATIRDTHEQPTKEAN
ncbi:MAG: CBS domain-containing protein [Thermoplasmata archaeon]|nr:CBS domain-containing protein [Thermoplasmata archaeon]TFG67798.1 MAG: CBS domain-containing protein [Methanomassiliicoccus sp.]